VRFLANSRNLITRLPTAGRDYETITQIRNALEIREIPAYRQALNLAWYRAGKRNPKQITSVYQSTRKSGCRMSENQDIRRSGNERISKPEPLIS
jgi:hypothetical protein